MTPFVKKMTTKMNDKDYIILISISLIIPGMLGLIATLFKIKTSDFFTNAILPMVLGYYICGYFISTKKINKKIKNISILIFAFFMILSIWGMYNPFLKTGELSFRFDNVYSMPVIAMSISLFTIIKYYFENLKIKKIIYKIIEEISKVTFGIYLLHYIFIRYIYNNIIIQKVFNYNGYIGMITMEISVFVLCGIITFIIKRIPVIKKFL